MRRNETATHWRKLTWAKTLSLQTATFINGANLEMMEILIKSSINEAEDLIRKSVEKHAVLLIVGNCWVEYRGRASSKLSSGERILIIKQDGALLVHRPTGYEPINWMPGQNIVYYVKTYSADRIRKAYWFKKTEVGQPSGCIFQVQTKDNILEIRAVRRKPAESVRVFFDKIHMVSALSLKDSGEFSLYASEEDMQKAILLEPSILEEGFKPISFEKKVEPGFVDIYGVDKNGKLVVVEIKRKTAGKEAALQLAKYIDAIKVKANREVRGILAAPAITKDVQRLLATLGLEFKALNPKKCAEILKRTETRKLEAFFKEEKS